MITKVNGEPVQRSGALSSVIGMAAPGERVRLEVWRERAAREIEARLGGTDEATSKVADAAPEAGGRLGLALRPLSPDERRAAGIEQGLLIENVAGAAARAGVEPGDVLLAVNGRAVQSIEQVRAVLERKPKSVALLVQRDGERIFVPVGLA